jgi:hypothetical protein
MRPFYNFVLAVTVSLAGTLILAAPAAKAQDDDFTAGPMQMLNNLNGDLKEIDDYSALCNQGNQRACNTLEDIDNRNGLESKRLDAIG